MSRNEKTALVVVILSIGALVVSVLAGLGYYGFKRYMDRSRETRRDLERRITSDSTADATEDIVDEDYRFKLTYPGPGFKLMREEDAARVQPEAIAGLFGTGCWSVVTAEHLPGADLDDVANAYIAAMPVTSSKIISREETTVSGKLARSTVLDGIVMGANLRYRSLVVENDGWFLRALAWTQADQFSPCSAVLDRSFSILPGPVKGRTRAASVSERANATFRIRGRTFESAAYRLRVDVPEGFRLQTGHDALVYDWTAAVSLTKGSMVVVIGTERAPRPSVARAVEATSGSNVTQLGPLLEKRWKKRVAGADVELRTFDGVKPFRTAWGMTHVDGVWMYVRLIYPSALESSAESTLDAVLAGVNVLSKDEATKLAAELPKGDDEKASPVGESLRAGVYTDYVNRFRLRLPDEPIVPVLEPELAGGEERSAEFMRPMSGVSTIVMIEKPSSAAEESNALTTAAVTISGLPPLQVLPVPADTSVPGARRGHVSLVFQNGESALYDMHEMIGKNVVFLTYGLERNVKDASEATEAFVRGFQADPAITEHQLSATRLRNDRFGFQLDLPGGGFTSTRLEPGTLGDAFILYQAEKGATQIGLMAFNAPLPDDDFVIPFFEQMMAERVQATIPTRKHTRLGNLDARHLIWDNGFEMAIARDGTHFYSVFLGTRGDLDAATVFKEFRVD